jgi:hypothetical protein
MPSAHRESGIEQADRFVNIPCAYMQLSMELLEAGIGDPIARLGCVSRLYRHRTARAVVVK